MPTLFCDLGGVVFADAPERPVDQWRAANGGRLGIERATELGDERFREFETGRLAGPEYARHLRTRLDWQGSDDDLIRIWNSAQGPVVLEVLETLSGLRERGWQLIAAINTDPWRDEARQEQFGWVMSVFERVVSSVRVGARKPDPRFFAEMLRELPRQGPRIYVDDDPQVVSAARRAGVDAHVFSGAAGLKSACQSLTLTTH